MAQKQKQKYLVEKRNVLNEIIASEFTLQELRLFSIYLGRIDARRISSRVVRFPLKWFYEFMDLKQQKIEYLDAATKNLLTKVVKVPIEGGHVHFQLFKECRIYTDSVSKKKFFEIDAHDRALHLMFKFKRDYFHYELWNVLNLQSTNQFRMYEILKQYEYDKKCIISFEQLKALLGLSKDYRWDNFKSKVLRACQLALKEKTDISFNYEIHSRCGRGGKVESLRFTIEKNANHKSKVDVEELLGAETVKNLKEEAELDIDLSSLDFIAESISGSDKQYILIAADGDVDAVKKVYDIAKQTRNIDNLVGFLIAMIKKDKLGELSEPVNRQRQNKFLNFPQRNIDFEELERLELKMLRSECVATQGGSNESDAY